MCWNAFQRLLNKSIQDVINFAKKIPGFTNLDQEDQISLIKGGCFEVREKDAQKTCVYEWFNFKLVKHVQNKNSGEAQWLAGQTCNH